MLVLCLVTLPVVHPVTNKNKIKIPMDGLCCVLDIYHNGTFNKAIITVVFVCPHTYLPKTKPLTGMFLLGSLKKKKNCFMYLPKSGFLNLSSFLVLVIVFVFPP